MQRFCAKTAKNTAISGSKQNCINLLVFTLPNCRISLAFTESIFPVSIYIIFINLGFGLYFSLSFYLTNVVVFSRYASLCPDGRSLLIILMIKLLLILSYFLFNLSRPA